jgi:hypothetical protein
VRQKQLTNSRQLRRWLFHAPRAKNSLAVTHAKSLSLSTVSIPTINMTMDSGTNDKLTLALMPGPPVVGWIVSNKIGGKMENPGASHHFISSDHPSRGTTGGFWTASLTIDSRLLLFHTFRSTTVRWFVNLDAPDHRHCRTTGLPSHGGCPVVVTLAFNT